jgi:hypothetical protein
LTQHCAQFLPQKTVGLIPLWRLLAQAGENADLSARFFAFNVDGRGRIQSVLFPVAALHEGRARKSEAEFKPDKALSDFGAFIWF